MYYRISVELLETDIRYESRFEHENNYEVMEWLNTIGKKPGDKLVLLTDNNDEDIIQDQFIELETLGYIKILDFNKTENGEFDEGELMQ